MKLFLGKLSAVVAAAFIMAVPVKALCDLKRTEKDLVGFVQINHQRELYVHWTYAQGRRPTVILINGLTYSTEHWTAFAKALTAKGFGVVRYDPFGMGKTLLKQGPVLENISYQDQADDLKDLIKKLGLTGKLNLIGLSYGGGLGIAFSAKYPELVKNMIAMAPYTEPVATQEQWVKSQIWFTRSTMPWNTATDDELYEFYFRQLVYLSFPVAEPTILENPLKLEATYRMALGIRNMDVAKETQQMPPRSLHLIISGADQYIDREVLEKFWEKVPQSVKATKTIFNNVEHKIPEAAPGLAADYVEKIITESNLYSSSPMVD